MCTRVFNNKTEFLTTGRNMDWDFVIPANLWAFKSGIARKGMYACSDYKDIKPLKWTSKYGSVVSVVSDKASSDGINTEGLVCNLLYLADTKYPNKKERKGKKGLNVHFWVQYILDSFKSVKEVVKVFEENNIAILNAPVPGDEAELAFSHVTVSDMHGDSVVLEIKGASYKIYHKKSYRVVTNDPTYKKQLTLNDFWKWQWSDKNDFPSNTLPGESYPASRFARASFYVNHLSKARNEQESIAQTLSILRNTAVPYDYVLKKENQPSTLWSSIATQYDKHNLLYFYDNVTALNTIWANVSKLHLDSEKKSSFQGAQARVRLLNDKDEPLGYMGCVNEFFESAKNPYPSPK